MLEVADSMKMLSATTVTVGAISVATINVHKVGNSPKKPAARRFGAKKGVEKQGSKGAAKGGSKRCDVKGVSIRETDFFNFSQPGVYPGEDQGSGTVSVNMGITKLSPPFLQPRIIINSARKGQKV